MHQPTLGETCGQNKAVEISAADVPWSEGQNPKLVRSFSPQNLTNMDLGKKKQIQVGDGSPVPRTLSIIYSGGVMKLSRLSHGPWFSSYPLKFRVQVQSFASLSRWEITPMSIMILSDFHGNHQPYFSILKSR